ncbi:MFS transporter [Opitutus sp. GAS368]|uniref:MFS transporter n=1 Tax=Opitutus sp. GAS368 TaxID=1882749 RepID=UPI00087D212C|nr:MFS transporter [Opitutus sp. GAS368]SDS48169.1 Major Facilitator Superfamily protein [Opitutus sp. GAS368]
MMIFPGKKHDPELYPYRGGIYFSFFNALNWQVAIGTPTVLFMQQLGADSFQVGLVFSWTFLLTPAQVLSTTLLSRFGYKRLTMAGWGARSLCLLVPIGLSLLAPPNPVPWMINAMVLATFVYCLLRAVGTSALTTWFYQLVPAELRGRYWATDQLSTGVAIGISLLVYAAFFTWLPPYTAFILLYLISVLGAFFAYRQLKQLPDAERPKPISLEKVMTETPRLMMTPSFFRTYLWIAVVFFAGITPLAPFAAYYLKTSAGVTAAQVILLTMLTYVGLIVANIAMRKHMDQIGAKPFFKAAFLCYAFISVAWIVFLSTGGKALWTMPILFFLQGAGSGFWNSANLSYLVKILPEHDRALPVSIHGAVMTFIGGCTPVLWGLFLKAPGAVPAIDVPVFAGYYVSLLVMCVVLVYFVRRLPETAGPVGPIFQGSWALRPFRAMATLVNLIEEKPAKDGGDKPASDR